MHGCVGFGPENANFMRNLPSLAVFLVFLSWVVHKATGGINVFFSALQRIFPFHWKKGFSSIKKRSSRTSRTACGSAVERWATERRVGGSNPGRSIFLWNHFYF